MVRPGHCLGGGTLLVLLLLTAGVGGCGRALVSGGALDRHAVVQTGRRVSEFRQLPFLHPVQVRLIPRADLYRTAADIAGHHRLSRRSLREQQMLSLLGLVPWGTDLSAVQESTISRGVGGMYHPDADRLDIVAGDVVRSEVLEIAGVLTGQDLTFGELAAHELAHALQDQHFGLDPPAWASDNSDADLAYSALVEGDAFLSAFFMGAGALLTDEAGLLEFITRHAPDMGTEVPSYVQERFKFPYLNGAAFVLSLRTRGGWEAVNAAHRDPPWSSLEILEPERYLIQHQPPHLPDLSGLVAALPGTTQVHEDTLGAFAIGHLLSQESDPRPSSASGWVGDRAAVFERTVGGGLVLVWIADWETPADAAKFIDRLEGRLSQTHGPADQASLSQARWTHGERWLHLQASDRRVVLLNAPAHTDLWAVLQSCWQADSQPLPTSSRVALSRSQDPLDPEDALRVDQNPVKHYGIVPLLKLGNASHSLSLGALLQVRAGGDGGGSRIGVERLRLRADGLVTDIIDLHLKFQIELNQVDSVLQDAFLSFSPASPSLLYLGHLQIGRFVVPFNGSLQLPEEERGWPQSPLGMKDLALERRPGLGYSLDLERYNFPLKLSVGLFDGFPEGAGRGPLLAARVSSNPIPDLPPGISLELGSAYARDRNRGDTLDRIDRTWQGLSFDLNARVKRASIEGDFLVSDPAGEGTFEGFNWMAGAGWFLLPDFLQLVARYEERRLPKPFVRQISWGAHLFYLGQRFRMSYLGWYRRPDGEADQQVHLLLFQSVL